MTKQRIGYHGTEREDNIDIDSYGKLWVIIDIRNSVSIAGRLERVFKDRLLLMPYQTVTFCGGRQKYEVVRTGLPYLIERIDLCGIKQTSEENIQGYCNYNNKQAKKEKPKKKTESKKLLPN